MNEEGYRHYRDIYTGLIRCPKCNGLFGNRRDRKCPACGIPLYLPFDGVQLSVNDTGYLWRRGKWWSIDSMRG